MCIRHGSNRRSRTCACKTRVNAIWLNPEHVRHIFSSNNVWAWTNVKHVDSMDPDPHWGRNMNLDKVGNNGQHPASWKWPQTFLPFKDPHPAFNKQIFNGRSSVNPPQHTYTTWYKVHTELFLDLKILIVSQKLDKNFKFHKELTCEEQKQILLSFTGAAGTWRFKMTSTSHGPSEVSADGLELPNTRSADGLPNKDL
jgi:hypothetical protein